MHIYVKILLIKIRVKWNLTKYIYKNVNKALIPLDGFHK